MSGYLIGSQEAGKVPLPPEAELQWWYQYYFATERGRVGYDRNRRDFAKLIWRIASPKWASTTSPSIAAARDNPDHVEIVIHNYRWRLGLADGEADYEELEQRLAQAGDRRADHHPGRRRQWRPASDPGSYAEKFAGAYSHRTIEGGVGHNLPKEAPEAFANAVIEVTDP